ncbi:hypothetical protein ACQ4PT_019423 [Festuca glaucescens]
MAPVTPSPATEPRRSARLCFKPADANPDPGAELKRGASRGKRQRKGSGSRAAKNGSKEVEQPVGVGVAPGMMEVDDAGGAINDDICAEEPDAEEMQMEEYEEAEEQAKGGEGSVATLRTRKKRVARPSTKRRADASEDHFVGEPIPDDEARQRWPERYTPKNCDSQAKKRSDAEEKIAALRHYRATCVDGAKLDLGDDVYVKENPIADLAAPPAEQMETATLLDLYSGCGAMSTGLCLGASLSGLKLNTKWAVDMNIHACNSLKHNHPGTQVRNEKAEDFLSLLWQWDDLCKKYDVHNNNSLPRTSNNDEDDENEPLPEGTFEVEKIVDICYGDPNRIGNVGLHFKQCLVAYNETEDKHLAKALVIRDAISDLPKDYSIGDATPKEGQLFDHQPLQLNDDDYERVQQIPVKKGANFRDLKGVRVGQNNTVEFDPDSLHVLVFWEAFGAQLCMTFIKGKSLKPFGRLWWDETVATIVTRAETHNQVILHPAQHRVLTIRKMQGYKDSQTITGYLAL